MESGSHSGAGDFVSPFLDIHKQLQLLKQKLACIPKSIKKKFLITTDHMKWVDVGFSWITKGGIELPPAEQEGECCWAWAFYRGHRYFTAVNGLQGFESLTYETFRNGIPKRHLDISGGIVNIENAKHYLIANNHVKDMIVYRRPLQNYEDAGFEVLIEKLLLKGPVVVSFDMLPSYRSYFGTGIYIPNVMECQTTAFEIYPRHCAVITGVGAQKVNGVVKEFWEIQDSKGEEWGKGGFDCLARGMGLIREAVEFKF